MSNRVTETPPFFHEIAKGSSNDFTPMWKGFLLALDKAVNGVQDPPQTVTGSSPQTLRNTTSCVQIVIVNGGASVVVSYSQDGSTYYAMSSGSQFVLFPGDFIKISWTTAPTITVLNR